MPDTERVAQTIYGALANELVAERGYADPVHDWKPWPEVSFEIKDRYRRIAQKVIDADAC